MRVYKSQSHIIRDQKHPRSPAFWLKGGKTYTHVYLRESLEHKDKKRKLKLSREEKSLIAKEQELDFPH